jgi:hypothetical protein
MLAGIKETKGGAGVSAFIRIAGIAISKVIVEMKVTSKGEP